VYERWCASQNTSGDRMVLVLVEQKPRVANHRTSTAQAGEAKSMSVRGVAFGPNLGSPDYLDLFRVPDAWKSLRSSLTAFKVYGDNVHADSVNQYAGCAGNTYGNLVNAGVFKSLREWALPIHLETGALKEYDIEGKRLADLTLSLVERVRNGGGEVAIVAMDEPLFSTVGRGVVGPDRVGDLARYTAEYALKVAQAGPGVGLIEAYPASPVERLAAFVRHIVTSNGFGLAFLELDVDMFALRDNDMSENAVKRDLVAVKALCEELRLPFRLIVTATRGKDAMEYHRNALNQLRLIRKLIAPVDGVTVQSWLESPTGDKDPRVIPNNLPIDDANSHLGIVKAVLDAEILRA
jgi:hypothetical protein